MKSKLLVNRGASEFDIGIDPHLQHIPEFNKIIEEGDEYAKKAFAYIYNMHNPESPYFNLEQSLREEEILRDFKDFEPDQLVRDAEEKYLELTESKKLKLLKSVYQTVDQLQDYFEQVDFNTVDDKGKPIHRPKDVISNISKLSDVLKGLDDLVDAVKKEEQEISTRGDVKINRFNK